MTRSSVSSLALLIVLCSLICQPEEARAQDEGPTMDLYALAGLTVPLLPQSFARSHELGFGGTAGIMLRAPFRSALFAEFEYGYTPISFLGVMVDYGNMHQTGVRGGIRYFFTEREGPQPFVTLGGGMSYANFGPAQEVDDEPVTEPTGDEIYPERSSHWHPGLVGGAGTAIIVQNGISLKSEVQVHLGFMDHQTVFYATPRIGMIYTW